MNRTLAPRVNLLSLGLALMVTTVTLATPSQTHAAQTHVVVGQDDAAVDRIAIQSAIDGAEEKDTIELRGLFQLDGESILIGTSRLTLAGQAIDNDGDGAVNEDWADGLDNDADGSVDEDDWDAVLVGVDDGAGGPARDAFPDRFNDGIEILGFNEDLRAIRIHDIKFIRLNRSIYLFPDYDDSGTVFVCDSSSPTSGELDDVTIERNRFEGTVRGVELLGRVNDITVEENHFADLRNQAVLMFGDELGCAEANGDIVQILPLGTPRKTRVVGNQFAGGGIGVLSLVTEKTLVACNQFSGQSVGVLSIEDEKLSATRNEIDGTFIGLLGSFDPRVTGPAFGNKFRNNTLSDNVFGVVIDCETTGYRVSANTFLGSLFADIFLDGTNPGGSCGDLGLGDSFGNTVVADAGTTILDFGSDNTVIIDDEDSDSDSDSDPDCNEDSDSG